MRHPGTSSLCTIAAGLALATACAVASQAGEAAPPTVGQRDRSFSTEALDLRAGAVVRFVNDDAVAHNIVVRDPAGATQASPLQRPGEHTDIAFPLAGEHEVRCALHPRMRMTVRTR